MFGQGNARRQDKSRFVSCKERGHISRDCPAEKSERRNSNKEGDDHMHTMHVDDGDNFSCEKLAGMDGNDEACYFFHQWS
jgi:hypothetical protein